MEWYVSNEGSEPLGPLATDLVARGILARKVPFTSLVCAVGDSRWMPLAAVPEFSEALREVAPPPDATPPPPPLPPPDAVQGASWWMRYPNQQAMGPYPGAAVLERLQSGVLLPTVEVCRVGEQAWRRAVDQPGFAVIMPAMSNVPPQPPRSSPASFEVGQPVLKSRAFPGVAVALSTVLGIAAIFGVAFFINDFRARAAAERVERERRQNPLFSPCLGQVITELRTDDNNSAIACGAGHVQVAVSGRDIELTFKPDDPRAPLGAHLPQHVAMVLPNIGTPDVSRRAPCRAVLPLELTATSPAQRLSRAAESYRKANAIVQAYERAGGHRLAQWRSPGAVISVENRTGADDLDGGTIVFRVLEGAVDLAATGEAASWPSAPWDNETTCAKNESAFVTTLRKKMMADGWLFDDADAFMSAAKSAGHADGEETADEVSVVARMLTTAKDYWSEPQKAILARDCMAPAIRMAGSGFRVPYDTVSGLDRGFDAVAAPPAPYGLGALFVDPAGADQEIRRFDAMARTPIHCQCVLGHLRDYQGASNSVHAFGIDSFLRKENVSRARWIGAWKLASHTRFATALYLSLVESRAALVKPEKAP